jgi:hypothetical protein
MNRLIVLTAIAGLVSGCGITQPTGGQLTAHQQTETSRTKCYEAVGTESRNFALSISAIPADQRMMVVMMHNQGELSKQMLSLATGRSLDPCPATNMFDAEIAEVQSKNQTVSHVIDGAWGVVPWVVGGFTINALADKAGGYVINNSGSGDVNQASKNSGAFNTAGNDLSNTASQTNTDNSESCVGCNNEDQTNGEARSITPAIDTFDTCEDNGGWFSPGCSCHSHFIVGKC